MKTSFDRRNVCIVLEPSDFEYGDVLRSHLNKNGDTAEINVFNDQESKPVGEEFLHIVTFMSRQLSGNISDRQRVQQMIDRLHGLATISPGEADKTLIIVQINDNSSTAEFSPEILDHGCATSFARSLHLERPDLRICVLEFNAPSPPEVVAERVFARLDQNEPFFTARIDPDGREQVPVVRLQQPAAYQRRPLNWSDEDVILVTGGAKGITAACSLALARETGARFALVGRSPLPTDASDQEAEINRTLTEFEAIGVRASYYQCDVSDPEQVQLLLGQVREELGPVTGVVHGAGVNRPRRADSVSTEEAFREIAPKLMGGLNLCRALEASPPKLFVALTSIIGVTGMPGNAWYACSNEALDLLLQRFNAAHPETSVQSVAFSVWDEVGMGHRMKSVETLGRMGISAIPTGEGVGRFVQLFTHDPGCRQVVVTARLGGLDTWPMKSVQIPESFRFIEEIHNCQPGVELDAHTHLTLERDRYLEDHNFRGSHLFPTVFGLEAMAQAAAVVTGNPSPKICRIEQISLERPIVVNPEGGTEISIRAVAEETNDEGETTVAVQIRSEQTGFSIAHFSALVVLGSPAVCPETRHAVTRQLLEIEPLSDLYGSLLFQGPRFQRMGPIQELDGEHAVFQSDCFESNLLSPIAFSGEDQYSFLLGDPFLRDVLLQAGQLTIPQHVCLPIQIERIEFFGNEKPTAGKRIVVAPFKIREGNEYRAEIYVTDEDGRMLEQLSGYRLRILEERPDSPTAEELAEPDERDTRLLQHRIDVATSNLKTGSPTVALAHLRNLHEQPRPQRHEQEQPVIEQAANAWSRQTAMPEFDSPEFDSPEFDSPEFDSPEFDSPEFDSTVKWLENGKPVFLNNQNVDLSITHDDGCCVVCVGAGPQGCDVLPITSRTEEEWNGLFGNNREHAIYQLVEEGDSLDESGSRIWTALEAVRKATQQPKIELTIESRTDNVVLLTATADESRWNVLTFPFQLTRGPRRMFAFVLDTETQPLFEDQSPTASASSSKVLTTSEGGVHPFCHSVDVTNDGPHGQPVQQLRFVVSFQEASTISRHVPAAQYLKWMGKMRELVTSVNVPSLVDLISTGQWGLVTNWGDVHIHSELTANDVVQMRFWTDAANGSEVQFYCDFWRQREDGNWEQAAFAEQKATWVRLLGHGLVEAAPLPEEFAAFIERMGPNADQITPDRRLPRTLDGLDRGEILFTAAPGPNGTPHVCSKTFGTTLEESNLVGNIYFANYFSWQQKVRDAFLQTIDPGYHHGIGEKGEMIGLRSRMDYLREAMPFEDIRVEMSLQELTTCGGTFRFDFYALHHDGSLRKLSVGRHEVAWVQRNKSGLPVPQTWPTEVSSALMQNSKVDIRVPDQETPQLRLART